jgi:hypothetical protein
MGWATRYIDALKRGETVQFRPRGHSMTGKVNDGQLVTVAPLTDEFPEEGDVVLCKVNGREYLHLVKAVTAVCEEEKDADGKLTALVRRPRYLIGNNKGHTNGWTSAANVFGKVVKVE